MKVSTATLLNVAAIALELAAAAPVSDSFTSRELSAPVEGQALVARKVRGRELEETEELIARKTDMCRICGRVHSGDCTKNDPKPKKGKRSFPASEQSRRELEETEELIARKTDMCRICGRVHSGNCTDNDPKPKKGKRSFLSHSNES